MKAATIVPQAYLPMIEKEDYHLALAHLIGTPGFEEYTKFYQNIGGHPDKFLIMDNGLIEGNPRPIIELLAKADFILADEVVLPDVFQDKAATLKAVYEALRCMDSLQVNLSLRTMAVPQGSDMDEWMDCAKELLQWPVSTLGIPKVLTKMGGRDARLHVLEELQSEIVRTGVQVHLLGCWSDPLELKMIENYTRQGKIEPVRGVDSAISYVYARAGLKMSEAERPSGTIDFSADDADLDILKYNIEMWKSECATLPPIGSDNGLRRIL